MAIEEWDLLEFFGVEPKVEGDTTWPYNDFCYEVEREGFSLSFALNPANSDITMTLRCGEQTVYELVALSVKDIRTRSIEDGSQVLEVVLADGDVLSLVVEPTITVNHRYASST